MIFYLGVHNVSWLNDTSVPLFVSRRCLLKYRRLPQPLGTFCLDSGGFTELSLHGKWTISPQQYVDEVGRICCEFDEHLLWAAPQDWMCEPFICAKTGKTVREHQLLTVENYLELKRLAPELPFIPVLQGWERDDYFRHVEDYAAAGVDLWSLPTVAIGSVCRRQHTKMAEELVCDLAGMGLRLHAFGVKTNGLKGMARHLYSSDSMAWSFTARRQAPLPGCRHMNCANCLRYALQWRDRVVQLIRNYGG